MIDSVLSRPVPGVHVRARDWGWRHAGRGNTAVSALTLDIEPGERVLLLGASGAGKSTLLQAIAGVLGGEEEGEELGSLLLDGRHPTDARGRVGLVLQDPDSQIVLARIGDDVAFSCENLGVPRDEIWRRVEAALRAVGLDLPLRHPSSNLSGGQKQRLALARGVLAAKDSDLILLDEPTSSVDPATEYKIYQRMFEAFSDKVVISSIHRLHLLENFDYIYLLDKGRIISQGSFHSLLANDEHFKNMWDSQQGPVVRRLAS